jgi:branched-chain amino acid aminotransferase
MKVYRGSDKLRVFRPERNCSCFRVSRISLPLFEPQELQKLILALIAVDGPKWLPKDRAGSFLYFRPTTIGTQPQLGVQAPKEALLYIIMSFMPRLDTVPGGMRLLTYPGDMVRAWAGGFGFTKIGPNYGPSVLAQQNACSRGFHQVLWLYGQDGECTEAGGSNFFMVWMTKEARRELVTAPLDGNLILDGVTRTSCIDLTAARLSQELVVTERRFTIGERCWKLLLRIEFWRHSPLVLR